MNMLSCSGGRLGKFEYFGSLDRLQNGQKSVSPKAIVLVQGLTIFYCVTTAWTYSTMKIHEDQTRQRLRKGRKIQKMMSRPPRTTALCLVSIHQLLFNGGYPSSSN